MKGFTIQHSIDLLEKKVDQNTGGGASSASQVSYDNAESGLTSDNVQGAIDELKNDIPNITPVKSAIVLPFIDTSTVVQATQTAGVETLTYTATQDCAIVYVLQVQNTKSSIEIDDVEVACFWSTQQSTLEGMVFVKAGQKFDLVSATSGCAYTVYDLIPAFPPANNTRKKNRRIIK